LKHLAARTDFMALLWCSKDATYNTFGDAAAAARRFD
jgi:hypothetical protein